MSWFRRLALSRFLKAHPPGKTQPAATDLIAAYAPVLPASLLELWRKKGLGHYGRMQFALIDPRQWQPVLDRWIVSPPDAVQVFRSRSLPSARCCTTASSPPPTKTWSMWIRSPKPPAI